MSLKIAIDAQLIPGTTGGTHTFLIGLVQALGRLEGPEEYVIVGPWGDPDWLKPHLGPNQRIVRGPGAQAMKRALGPVRPLLNAVRRVSSWASGSDALWSRSTKSSGFYETLGCDVLHFPYQKFVSSALPAVFNPHDLQHVHYPQFFSEADYKWREAVYGTACRSAHTVVVHSNFVKDDVVRHYGIAPDKVQVIFTPAPTKVFAEPTAESLAMVREHYGIRNSFALYPAVTWQHKNHLRLTDAFVLLRDRGVRLDFIGTGRQTEFFAEIQAKIRALGLDERMRFLGIVPAEHLRALYRLAQFTVLPTLFEGAGLPLVEAWNEGSPVACSGVTSLGEIGADAALQFDPLSAGSIADAMQQLAESADLRAALIQRGSERSKHFNWENAATAYRAVYRRAAGSSLTAEDERALRP
jgi:glycosyltransferase involved in cell wall biosynthesis